MVRRASDNEPEPADRDERLGEAIEAYLALAEAGQAPDPSAFAAGYPDLEEDLVASLDGLALVQGLVGEPTGPGHRLESGRRVAGYRIVRELGRGGMGIVYEAVHVGLDRPVALKVLGSSAAPDSTGRRRFLNEARTAAGLHHTHIVPVFDVGQVGGLCYYAMQRIEGSGLDRVIKHLRRDRSVAAGGSTYPGRTNALVSAVTAHEYEHSGLLGDSTATWAGRGPKGLSRELDDEPTPFEPPRGSAYYRWVATVGRQAAEALAHAHQRGVIHRDVKPSNLLVDARGVVWMADFGLARRLADPSQTQLDSLLGTPRYMSPEQARTGPIDGRSDVYSLGATLYELLTLRPPFEGKTAAELIDQIATREPAPVHQIDPKVPRDLETIVLKALHKRADDRYASAAELADDLERYLNFEPVRARRIGPIGRAWRVARRNKLLTIVSTVATAAVIISTAFSYFRILHERNDAYDARTEAQNSATKLEVAIKEAQSALYSQLIQNAEVVRMSAVADRRATGLDLLKRAALLPSQPNQRVALRDAAVAFLAIRDVEKRPEIALNDSPQGFVFSQDGQHISLLSRDGGTVRFWDVANRTLIETQDFSRPDDLPRRRQGRPGNNPFGGPPLTRVTAAGEDVAVIHPDGKGIRLFNPTTGAITGNLRLFDRPISVGPPEGEREIVSLAFSTDGRRFVTIERSVEFDFGRSRRNDNEGTRPGEIRPARPDYRVHLWNSANLDRPLASLYESKPETKAEPFNFGRYSAPLIAISPDGGTVAVAPYFDAEISLWSKDGKEPYTIDSQAQLTALALGSEGLLAAAGNRAVHLWDLNYLDKTKASLPALTPNLLSVDQLRFSPEDASLLVVAARGSGLELWDIAATSRVATLPLSGEWHGIAIAPKSKLLAVGHDSSLAVWALVNPHALTQIAGFTSPVRNVTFAPNGDLAMLDRDGSLRLWTQGRCPAAAPIVESARFESVAFDSESRLVAQLRNRIDPRARPTGPAVDRIDWLSVPDLKSVVSADLPRSLGGPWGGLRPPIQKIVSATNDQTLVMIRSNDVLISRGQTNGVAGLPARIESLDLPDSARFTSTPFGPGAPPDRGPPSAGRGDRNQPRGGGSWRDVAVNPAGNRIFLVSRGIEEVSGWSLKDNRLERLPWSLAGRFPTLALSGDGTTLAVGERNGTVFLLDSETGRVLRHLSAPDADGTAPVDALAFSPDRSELAVGSSGQVRIWSIGALGSRPFIRLPGFRGPVYTLAYDHSGQRLASGGEDRTVKVWDLERVRDELRQLKLEPQ